MPIFIDDQNGKIDNLLEKLLSITIKVLYSECIVDDLIFKFASID